MKRSGLDFYHFALMKMLMEYDVPVRINVLVYGRFSKWLKENQVSVQYDPRSGQPSKDFVERSVWDLRKLGALETSRNGVALSDFGKALMEEIRQRRGDTHWRLFPLMVYIKDGVPDFETAMWAEDMRKETAF